MKDDIQGKRFGRLVAKKVGGKTSDGHILWFCECDCGGTKLVSSSDLRKNHTKSCGCLLAEQTLQMTTHNKSHTRLYSIWRNMKQRCGNPRNPRYKDYGGRGIKICDEWSTDFETFYNWSIANGYSDELSIDRIDNDNGYFPINCRWATAQMQANNKRKRGTN